MRSALSSLEDVAGPGGFDIAAVQHADEEELKAWLATGVIDLVADQSKSGELRYSGS